MIPHKIKNIYTSVYTTIRIFFVKQNFFALLTQITLVVLIRLPIDYKRIMQAADGDFGNHIYFAIDILKRRPVAAFTLAHSLWQWLLIGVWWISRSKIDFWQSTISFQVLSSLASTLIVFFWLGALPQQISPWKRGFWAVTLVIVAPIILPFLLDGKYYFGYIDLANYHNPTVHMLRPFALLMFILSIEAYRGTRHNWLLILFFSLVTIAATFLKPNYTLILVPAAGLVTLYHIWKRNNFDWKLLTLGLFLPALITMVAQYIFTYVYGDPGDKIVFLPFVVASINSHYLLLKFLLSILFPLVISMLCWRWIKNDEEMLFAWLCFFIGASQYYLLAEQGSRLAHGNFSWGLQVSLFILFAVTIRFLFKKQVEISRTISSVSWLPYLIYSPHVFAGILYYLYCFFSPHYV